MRHTIAVFALAAVPAAAHAQLATPPDWRWRTDAPARLVTGQDVPDSAWRFVAMPPGWHITTGPGALLYHPDHQGTDRFVLAAEFVLFPGHSPTGYGLFAGGQELDRTEPRYVGFLIRRDGRFAITRQVGSRTEHVHAWVADSAVRPHPGRGVVTNALRVVVERDSLVFEANGQRLTALPREGLPLEGKFGFRIGPGVNLHVTSLDFTQRLAPPRQP